MASIELPVTHIRQAPGLCGAATAQMLLHSNGLADVSLDVQKLIYEDIQTNTAATRPTRNIRPHDCPSWPTQLCTKCEGDAKFTCWCTYPPALTATLRQRGLQVTETAHALDLDAAARVLECIDANLAVAVLVENGLHWVAVTGYATGTGPADAKRIGGRWIAEIYIRDPNLETGSSVAADVWLDEYLSPVIQCGDFEDLHVVIGRPPAALQPSPSTPAAPTGVRIGDAPRPGRRKPPRPARRLSSTARRPRGKR